MKRYIIKDNKSGWITEYSYFGLHGGMILLYLFGIITGIMIGVKLFIWKTY